MSTEAASPARQPANIAIFCDGTSNTDERTWVTNVVRLRDGVAETGSDGNSQKVFYDWGVGTKGLWDKITGGAFGHGLRHNVEEAYRFLVQNYQPGDRIFIFGFSRGAFTARSVVGFIRQCSVIKKEHEDRIRDGYKLYKDTDVHPDHPKSDEFRNAYSHPTPQVEFIGVWDTVGALGVPANRIIELIKNQTIYRIFGRPKRDRLAGPRRPARMTSLPRNRHAFHDVKLSSIVSRAYQALAIDERRPVFSPSIWDSKPKNIGDGGPMQDVRQAWFAGDHSDVGGGNSNEQNSSLSLHWIAQAAQDAGLALNERFLESVKDSASATGRISESPTGVWRYAGSEARDMRGGPSGTECIHPSANERRSNASSSYAPENLVSSPLQECGAQA